MAMNVISRWLVGAAAVVLVVTGAWMHGRSAGVEAERVAAASRLTAAEQEYRKQADKLESKLAEAERRAAERVRTIYREVDPTGCADTTAPSGMLDQLR